jgi:hypothetical protein
MSVDILQQLPHGGAVVAVIAVVMIFLNAILAVVMFVLKNQKDNKDRTAAVLEKFLAEVADSRREMGEARKDYLERLDRLTDRDARAEAPR